MRLFVLTDHIVTTPAIGYSMNHVSFDILLWVLLAIHLTLKTHSITIHTYRLTSSKVRKGVSSADDMCHQRYKRILFYEMNLLLDKPHLQSSDLRIHVICGGYGSLYRCML
jgi:hypothetical protein